MKTTTADTTINAMHNIFARYGVPTQVVSDNGPPFQSAEYEEFLQLNGIQRILVSLTIPLQMGWLSGLCRLSSMQWSHQLTILQALFSDGFRIFSYLTEAHHTLLLAHPLASYSYSKNFALDCLWLHLILGLAWPASKTK